MTGLPGRVSDAPFSSRIPGFHKLALPERAATIGRLCKLSAEETAALSASLAPADASSMIENVIGVHALPLGVSTNFVVNGRDVLVPMAIEESSVVAAASNAARMARDHGGFRAQADPPVMIGQVQILDVSDAVAAGKAIEASLPRLRSVVNDPKSTMVRMGGGLQGVESRAVATPEGTMLVVHLLVDVRDAMGANAVNTVCESLAPILAELSGGRAVLRILSNYADRRLARASAVFDRDLLGGARVVEDMVRAFAFADADPWRAATHNKGVMNGIDAVVAATGNDTRAVEAGAHAWAARTGRYRSLTRARRTPEGHLAAEIELPLALGVVGGATKVHPTARVALKILGTAGAGELACVVASVGLAQNVAAVRALCDEGIQKGHMALHARNVAIMAGARGDQVEAVAERMVREGNVRVSRAQEILAGNV